MRCLFVPQCYSHCFQGSEEVIVDHWTMESHSGVTEPGLNIQRKDMVKVADIQRQETVAVRCNVRDSAG